MTSDRSRVCGGPEPGTSKTKTGPYCGYVQGLTAMLTLLRARLRLPSRAQECTGTAQKWLSHNSGQMVGCSGLETEMDLDELSFGHCIYCYCY